MIRNVSRLSVSWINDKTYHILLERVLPGSAAYNIQPQLDVRPYTSEELPGVFETKPECLSLYEMYQLAGLYGFPGGESSAGI